MYFSKLKKIELGKAKLSKKKSNVFFISEYELLKLTYKFDQWKLNSIDKDLKKKE